MAERSAYDLLSVQEAARVLRCSPQTIYRACHENRIPWFRLRERGRIVVPYYGLEALIGPHLADAVEVAKNATAAEVEA